MKKNGSSRGSAPGREDSSGARRRGDSSRNPYAKRELRGGRVRKVEESGRQAEHRAAADGSAEKAGRDALSRRSGGKRRGAGSANRAAASRAGSTRAGANRSGATRAGGRARPRQRVDEAARSSNRNRVPRPGASGERDGLLKRGARAAGRGRVSRELERTKRNQGADASSRRRLLFVALGVAVLLVVVAVVAVSALGNIKGHSAPHPAATVPDYSPVACTGKLLKTEIVASGSAAGGPVTFNVKLTNISNDHPCTIDAGRSNLGVVVRSGGAQVGDTTQCEGAAQGQHDRLLLDRGMSTSVAVQWPGRVSANGCGAGGDRPATPGTYSATLTLKDVDAAVATTNFVLSTSGVAPAPLPAASPTPTPEPTAATVAPQGGAQGADANGTAPPESVATAPAGTPSGNNSLPPSQ